MTQLRLTREEMAKAGLAKARGFRGRQRTDALNPEVDGDQLLRLMDHASDGFFVYDRSGAFLYVNHTACEMLGYTPAELLKLSMPEISVDYSAERFEAAIARVIAHIPETQEDTLRSKDGSVLPVEVRIGVIDVAGARCCFAVARDISGRRAAQRALGESEQRYRTLYEETPVMMHSIDRNGRLVSVNNRWLEVLGYDRGEVLGKLSTDFLTAASRQRAIDVELPRFFETGVARDVEYQMVKKNGEIVDVLFSATSETDAEGEVVRNCCFIVDETERKLNRGRAEEAVRQLTVTEERNRIAREIHDSLVRSLAQSLTGIEIQLDSATEMLAKDPAGARAEIASASRLAHQSLEEASRMIWDLHPPALVSGSLIEALRAEIAKACDEGIECSLEVVDEQLGAIGQPAELTILRIAQEALANVCRHSRATKAVVQVDLGASEANLVIRDDGLGFDTSAPRGMLSPTGGGFGLTNMRERTRLVGGRVQVRSTPGEGTVVEASLPYVSSAEKRIPSPSWPAAGTPPSERASSDIKVLVADDHEVVRRGVRDMLRQIDGIEVVGEATNGVEALEKVQTLKPDVALLDVQMPELDGVETTRRLRELGVDTRVILLTVHSEADYMLRGLRAGANAYLLKDADVNDLEHAIRAVHKGGSLVQLAYAEDLLAQPAATNRPRLTKRELDVLRLLSLGARNKEIAEQLGVSVNTIKSHVENIYFKLGARTRTQAVRYARKHGFIDT